MVANWVRSMTEDVIGGPPVRIGGRYVHPEHGEIEVLAGQYWGEHGLSNFWTWRIVATGETQRGYADDWPEVTNA